MKPSTELFDLIRSLTKAEKRYFRLFTENSSESKNYLQLFEAISKQKVYDEEDIKKVFHGRKFIKQLTFTKNYLYNTIIRSLIAFNYEKSVESRLLDALQKIKLLYRRGLFDQYFKAIQSAKEMAAKYEKFYIMLELVRIERVVIKINKYKHRTTDILYEEEKLYLDKIKNLGEYSQLFSRAIRAIRGGPPPNAEISMQLNKLMAEDIMQSEEKALSKQALEYFYMIKQMRYNYAGDHRMAYDTALKRLKLIESDPVVFTGSIIDPWIETIGSLIHLSMRLKDHDKFRYYIAKMESVKPRSEKDALNIDTNTSHLELYYYIQAEEYESAVKIIPYVDKHLKRFENKLLRDDELSILLNICIAYLHAEMFDEALKRINILLNNEYLKYRKHIHVVARLLNIIVHYELKNYDLVEYLIDSTKRFLDKKAVTYKLESSFIRLMRAAVKNRSRESIGAEVMVFKKSLAKMQDDPEQSPVFEYFDFLKWVNIRLNI